MGALGEWEKCHAPEQRPAGTQTQKLNRVKDIRHPKWAENLEPREPGKLHRTPGEMFTWELIAAYRHVWILAYYRPTRPLAKALLEFQWPHAPSGGSSGRFSFDLGGTFRGGHLENQSFVAEVKAYKKEHDLPTHFRDFLAKCYVALEDHPSRCDHFLWVSWAPFQAQHWDRHATAENVKRSVLHAANRVRTLGLSDESEAAAKLSAELLVGVAERVWLVTLSEKQEKLVLSAGHYVEVVKMITSERRVVS